MRAPGILALSACLSAVGTTAWCDVSGSVVSSDGRPCAGATINAYAPETTEARAERLMSGRSRTAIQTVRSSADGSFRLEERGPVAALEFRAEGFADAFDTAANGGTVSVVLRPALRRRGVVTANGKPVSGATLAWMSASEALGELIVTSGKDGSYEVPDPDAWAATLVVHHPDFALLEVSPDDGTWPTRLALDAGVALEGSVIDERTGRPVGGATLSVDGWPVGRSDAHGTFQIPHVASGWRSLAAHTDTLVGTALPRVGRLAVRVAPGRSLSGVVRDATSRPIAGALIVLTSERGGLSPIVVTDVNGRYAVSNVAPAAYFASVARPGYSARPGAMGPASAKLDLRRSLSLRRDFVLTKQRRLTGRVQDEVRRPVAGALLSLTLKGAPRAYGGLNLMGPETAISGPDGTFVFSLPSEEWVTSRGPGELVMVALKQGYAAGESEPLRLDQSSDPAILITLERGIELKGHVTTPDDLPVEGVAVALVEDGSFPGNSMPVWTILGAEGWARSGADGQFVTRVHPGIHHLSLRKSGYVPKLVRGYDPSAGTAVDIVLETTVELRGRVVRSDGHGVPDVRIDAEPGSNAPFEGMRSEGSLEPTTTQADGTFIVGNLSSGLYLIHASKEGTGLSESRPVEAPGDDIQIELGPAGSIHGRVVDANRSPVTRFSLNVARDSAGQPGGAPRGDVDRQIADPNGTFVIDDIPLGVVNLTVRAEDYRARTLEGVLVSSDLSPPPVEVSLEAGVTLRGRVTSTRGEPLSDVQVSVVDDPEGGGRTESDESGDYVLTGMRSGTVTLDFQLRGFVKVRKTVDAAAVTRVDTTLSRGLSLHGIAQSNDSGVVNASVIANTSAPGGDTQAVSSDEGGNFTLEGLIRGHYSLRAMTQDGREAILEDVDPETAGTVRLELKKPPTAVLSGVVIGLPSGDNPVTLAVSAAGENGRATQAGVDTKGTFRMEAAPVGHVSVTVSATTPSGSWRSSLPVDLELTAGSEARVTLDLGTGIVLTGSVTRLGVPVPGAVVAFTGLDGGASSSGARTDARGHYEAEGLQPGNYKVDVSSTDGSFELPHVVTEGGDWDIDITGAAVHGRIVDGATGLPVSGAAVSLWLMGGRENDATTSVETGGTGEFAAQSVPEGHYRLLTAKSGYGQQVRELDLATGTTAEADLQLWAAAGLGVSVTDARDGHALDAIVVVRDATRRIVANHAEAATDGSLRISLADGAYLLSTSAGGYGTATLPVTAPSSGLVVGLTPGGTLVVDSARNLRGRIRLVQPDGEEYVRCWCNGIADIELNGRHTGIPNITPGLYRVELVDPVGAVAGGNAVTIREGQTSTVSID